MDNELITFVFSGVDDRPSGLILANFHSWPQMSTMLAMGPYVGVRAAVNTHQLTQSWAVLLQSPLWAVIFVGRKVPCCNLYVWHAGGFCPTRWVPALINLITLNQDILKGGLE